MNPKQLAGEKAVEFVREGMIVGLGTGSTAYFSVKKIGDLVRNGFQIKAVCTSQATHELAVSSGITILKMDEADHIDLTIDGADEVDPDGHGIKGRWGALLFEKIVAVNSETNIWVVDESKIVKKLGKFPLPVEVIPFGYRQVLDHFTRLGFNPVLRVDDGREFQTDSGNYIIHLHLGVIEDPLELDRTIRQIPGVVEHGLFPGIVNKVIVANEKNIRILEFR
jgi:ribose 5-phosphate isomerase A